MNKNEACTTLNRGQWAEEKAFKYLCAKGLKLVTRNYHAPCGELDLIMKDKNIIVFIEVRYRSNNRYISALESIDTRKCERIIATSLHYLQHSRTASKATYRFDVVVLSGQTDKPDIEWIKNAFQA